MSPENAVQDRIDAFDSAMRATPLCDAFQAEQLKQSNAHAFSGRECGVLEFARSLERDLNLVKHDLAVSKWNHHDYEKAYRETRNELEAMSKKADANMLLVKACEYIAEGDLDWEKLRNECPSTAAVASLRDEYEKWRAAAEAFTRNSARINEGREKAEGEVRYLREKLADAEATINALSWGAGGAEQAGERQPPADGAPDKSPAGTNNRLSDTHEE